MTMHADPDPIIAGWLADGPTALPTDVRRAILISTIDRPQEVVGGPVRVRARTAGRNQGSLRLLLPLVAILGVVAGAAGAAALLRLDDATGPLPKPVDGTFRSPRYHYTIELPDGWTVQPATADWRIIDPWDEAPRADIFRSADGLRFSVASAPLGPGVDPATYAETYVPPRPSWDPTRRACRSDGETGVPGPTPTLVGSRPAWLTDTRLRVRAACGAIDAVLIDRSFAYVLALTAAGDSDADLRTFRTIASTIEPLPRPVAPTPARWTPRPTSTLAPMGPLDTQFESPRYAYAIQHPSDWIPLPASRTFVPGLGPLTEEPAADVLDGPGQQAVSVVALDLELGVGIDAWLETWAPERYAFDTVCKIGGAMFEGSTIGWQTTTVDDHDARVRARCGYTEAAIQVDQRLWYVAHRSARKIPGGDRAVLDDFLRTMWFDPAAPLGRASEDPIRAARYGYSITVPAGWTVELATEDFVPGRSWTAGRGADRYVRSGEDAFSVAAVDLAPTMTVETWLDRFARTRVVQAQGHFHCVYRGLTGTTTVESSPSGWTGSTVAGHPALVRSDCSAIDAAILIDRRLFLLSYDRGRPAPFGDRRTFDRFAETMVIDPPEDGDAAP
jgi:hypothetical protein